MNDTSKNKGPSVLPPGACHSRVLYKTVFCGKKGNWYEIVTHKSSRQILIFHEWKFRIMAAVDRSVEFKDASLPNATGICTLWTTFLLAWNVISFRRYLVM